MAKRHKSETLVFNSAELAGLDGVVVMFTAVNANIHHRVFFDIMTLTSADLKEVCILSH